MVPWPPERKIIDIGDVYSSYAKMQRVLGWQPTVGMEEGLERTVGYYKQYGEHYW